MWKIVRAELRYNWLKLAALYLATAAIWSIYLFVPFLLLQLFAVPALFLLVALFAGAVKEKRVRWHMLLPVPVKQRSAAGMLSFACLFHASIVSIWPLQLLVEPAKLANEYVTFWGMVALNGLFIGAVAAFNMRCDLKLHESRKYRWVIDAVLVLAVLCYLGFKSISRQSPETYAAVRDFFLYNPALAVCANALAAALIYGQTVIFAQRKSFLD